MAHNRRIIALAIASAIQLFESSVSVASAQSTVSLATILRRLAGTWKAAEDRTPREAALDEQVFGKGAFGVRNVTLTIGPSGEGTLQVHTAIIGHSGRVYVPSLIDVRLKVTEPVTPRGDQVEPTVSVVSAMKRDLDAPQDHWPLEGAHLVLNLPGTTSRELNIQFDTRDGRDGFGVTLIRRN